MEIDVGVPPPNIQPPEVPSQVDFTCVPPAVDVVGGGTPTLATMEAVSWSLGKQIPGQISKVLYPYLIVSLDKTLDVCLRYLFLTVKTS